MTTYGQTCRAVRSRRKCRPSWAPSFSTYGREGQDNPYVVALGLAGGVSPYSGTGRLRLDYPASSSFPSGSWGWTWGSGSFSSHTVYERLIAASIQSYRLGFYWEETDESHVQDIDIYLDAVESDGATVCSSGFAYQDDLSINNAIHIQAADIPSCAVYIQIRFVAAAMPSGTSRVVYSSDLWDEETSW